MANEDGPTSSHNQSQLRKRTLCITQVDKNRCFLSPWLQDLTVAACSFEYPHKFALVTAHTVSASHRNMVIILTLLTTLSPIIVITGEAGNQSEARVRDS